MSQQIIESVRETFEALYKTDPVDYYFSPGRINLIGEHTDYNGGRVFPCAITQGTYGAVKSRQDQAIRVYSMNLHEPGVIEFSLDELAYHNAHSWANYVKGMLHVLTTKGFELPYGFDLVVYGDIPNAAGLSSSASLELLIGVIAEDLYDLKLDRLDLIKFGQIVENDYVGVNTGIMDQFAIGMGEENMALYLDTNTLDYDLVPADFGDYRILIMNTNKRRELTDSKYNERRRQCETALSRLQTELSIETLGELSSEDFETHRNLIADPILEKRAKHAVYENERTQQAKLALEARDLVEFGTLLNQSHISLRDDYEVTGLELDTLVEAAWQEDSVLGARMTGAGMGGCAIALVHEEEIDSVIEAVNAAYKARVGYDADFYVAQVGDGTKKL